MSKGGLSVFLALILLFLGAFVLMSGFRLVTATFFPETSSLSWTDQMWRVFLQISDAGAVAEDGNGSWVEIILGIVTIFLGLVLFSSLVAFMTSLFEAKLTQLRKGKSQVVESGHTLILGFGDRVLEIIRELLIANESEKNPSIVVLADQEKDEMDDYFRDHLGKIKKTKLVTRSGSTSNIKTLSMVSVSRAKSVILLSTAADESPMEEKTLADARQIKTLMAVVSCCGAGPVPPLIVEFHLPAKAELARKIHPQVVVIDENSFLSKLIVQTSRISGLAHIYDQLVGFSGSEIYHFPLAQISSGGITYEKLVFLFDESTVLGVKKSDGTLRLNPPSDFMIDKTDEVIILAEDDSTIKMSQEAPIPTIPPASKLPPLDKKPEKQLLVGWNRKAPIVIEEYAGYLPKGSSLEVIIREAPEEMRDQISFLQKKYPEVLISLIEADIQKLGVLQELQPEKYDNVILLTTDEGEAEVRDAETITELLAFRFYFKDLKDSRVKTQLITEVADSENTQLIEDAGVRDFLITNQFVSKIYAQVSDSPMVYKVYEDLFSSAGNEIYLKPLSLFTDTPGTLSFGQLCALALRRGETCIGLRKKSWSDSQAQGYGIVLNPSKASLFTLTDKDFLITLAEDES
ncbi:MAG: hypothetical protein A2Z96_02755 [Spirochaetes bacterium GWB1_48_6]|nr:MAG: hypothetical protein A2Z96_02755 [Spirochaetes bacterium GWB1_48_6]